MRRTFLWLMSSIIMYCIYVYSLPPVPAAATAVQADAGARISAQLTLPARHIYAVTLGIFDTEDEARLAAAGYALRGAAGCTVEVENGWALIGAGYPEEGDAASVCAQLRSSEDIDAQVLIFGADDVRLSMTATRPQADRITAALKLLDDVPAELMSLAGQLDSGACDAATVRSLIAIRATDAETLLAQLSAELGNTSDIFCRMVETRLIELHEKLAYMCGEASPTGLMLSSHMKQCAIETWLDMINMMHTLS